MAIEIIDKLKQKNNGNFKLMDAKDVAIGDSDVENKIKETNSEIIEARGGENSLNIRLEKMDSKNSDALNNVYSKSEVDNKIFNMSNMGQDVKEAMTGGSVAVVGTDAVDTINIKDNAVNYDKISKDIINKKYSLNILDLDNYKMANITFAGDIAPNDTNYTIKLNAENGATYNFYRKEGNKIVEWKPRVTVTDYSNIPISHHIEDASKITIDDKRAYYMYIWNRGFSSKKEYIDSECMVLKNYNGDFPTKYIPCSFDVSVCDVNISNKINKGESETITNEMIVDNQVTYDKISKDVIRKVNAINVLDLDSYVNANISAGGSVTPSNTDYAIKIKVSLNDRYKFLIKSGNAIIEWKPRISVTDVSNSVLEFHIEDASKITINNNKACYMYVWNRGFSNKQAYINSSCMVLKNYDETTPTEYIPCNYKIQVMGVSIPKKLSDLENDVSISKWKDKNIVFYGDSITAQGNFAQGITDNTTGFGYYAEKELGFNAIYRGVGGQAFKRNNNTWYVNSDGSYAGRYGQNGMTVAPSGTTTHLGYFSSWDRITNSIPLAKRTTIDMVIVCGGHNDFASVEDVKNDGVITGGEPKWISEDKKDAEWANSSFYKGGDFDIDTFNGAIASTVMKLQLWCPNAIIVLATPFPRWDLNTNQQMKMNNLTFRQLCEIEIKVAEYMQIPVIDSNANCMINLSNFNENTQNDNTHPNELGRKNFGRVFINAINDIYPKII